MPYQWAEASDPEPVIVTLGERGWVRRAGIADVLLCTACSCEEATNLCGELFRRYPGLSLAVVSLPDGCIVVRSRDGLPVASAAVSCWFAALPAESRWSR